MTSTGTILKAMQAVLLVTVLTPATVFAGSPNTTHQVTQAQTQTQDQSAAGEGKHLKRGLILTPAEAATNPPVAPQVEIPPLPPRHDEATGTAANNNYSTAAAPAQATSTAQNASIVTLPAAAQPATDTTPAPITNATTDTAPAPVTPAAPAATAAPTPAAVATPAATPATTSAGTTTTPAVTTPTRTTQASHQSHSHHHSDDSFNVGRLNISSSNIERQATKFFNRRDVKSALAQFGF